MDVGIRDLKALLSQYLARVRSGECLVVTGRGVPVARLEPTRDDEPPAALQHLIDTGRVIYKGRWHDVPEPVRMLPGERDSTDYVRDQRR